MVCHLNYKILHSNNENAWFVHKSSTTYCFFFGCTCNEGFLCSFRLDEKALDEAGYLRDTNKAGIKLFHTR